MKTLKEILNKGFAGQEEKTEIEKIAAAAFWAGQSDMRGQITAAVAERFKALPLGRYHHLQRSAAIFVLQVGQINGNVLSERAGADDGRGESAEIMDWEFEI